MSEKRLIDANALCEDRVANDPVVIAAKCAPTIDAMPVVHGRWNPSPYTERRAKCSNCEVSRDIYTQIAWNYCPNCGAKMDLKDTDVPGKPEDCRYFTAHSYWGAGCLGTKEIDHCEGEGCKRWKPKMDGGAEG